MSSNSGLTGLDNYSSPVARYVSDAFRGSRQSYEYNFCIQYRGPIKGLLYVPSLEPQDPCNNNTASFVPANATRYSSVSPFGFTNIGLAPWVSIDCTQSFLNASRRDDIEALIFFLPLSNDSKPPPAADSIWDLGDGGVWKSQNKFPIYAIPGTAGETLMRQLSWYSGNGTTGLDPNAPVEEPVALGQDQRGVVRLFTVIELSDDRRNMPSLWGFILAILGMVLVLSIILLLCYQFVQRKRREALRRSIASGEADVESLGLHQIKVPREVLDQIPTYVYPHLDVPPKVSLKDSHGHTNLNNVTEPNDTRSIQSADSTLKNYQVYQERELHASSSTIRLPESVVISESSRSPSVRERSESFSRSQSTCAICLDDFVSGASIVRELPCGHIYHLNCIDTSLTQISSLCPLCKKSVLPPEYYTTPMNDMIVHRDYVATED
ncbi:RING-H2 finger protein [Aspergillus clavatus NRRL 1]|uniref:RING finger domain protein, putative n=1 Tax=Aspergillus clavatus (strain ATCC 1007 / CBS 513.65 / DSM 816 / NCTC 3887 / NRRL 1 / QM 1276 / 107) TaxID=344612 RepID=A1CRK2_ASPCL|nr:RING finger domain protein, putative [Aspergillus clavatus NRRL 1]EAW08273.1 RING finger domain protein, putative [Aspergillus clavatus NRRL 1]